MSLSKPGAGSRIDVGARLSHSTLPVARLDSRTYPRWVNGPIHRYRSPQLTSLTILTLAAILVGIFGSRGYGVALAFGGVTAAGAAFVAGSTVVPTFYAIAVGAFVAIVVRVIKRTRSPDPFVEPPTPGGVALVLLLLWGTLVTLAAPEMFSGITVLNPGGSLAQLQSGVFSASNFAQIVYLALGVSVALYLARSRSAGPELIGISAGLTILLSFWSYLHHLVGLPFPTGFFDNSPSFAFIDTAAGGAERFRGILSEPSGLAAASLVAVCYMASRAVRVSGWRRWGAIAVALIATYLASISTSGTFVVAGVIVAGLAIAAFVVRFILRGRRVHPAVVVAICAGGLASVWVLPTIIAFVSDTVTNKTTSSSFTDRSSANALSYKLFLETNGFGVGLGANRPSSFAADLVSTVGLIGTLLFAVPVIYLIWRSLSIDRYRPVVWALVALLIVKIVASPDLSDSSGVLWISIGLLSHAVWEETGIEASPFGGAKRLDTGTFVAASRTPNNLAKAAEESGRGK
jgi:hypothetical protein